MIFDQFDNIEIINLAHRGDRRREMNQELAKVGIADDPRVRFFNARMFEEPGDFYSRGARGVYASHLAILQEAAERGRSVLILEDDADFTADCPDYVVPDGTQIFYGGYIKTSHEDPYISDIVGAHMMGFSADIIPRLIQYFDTLSYEGNHPPIDAAYVWYRRAHPEAVTHFAVPPLAHQRPSRTDIGDVKVFDKIPIVRDLVGVARKLKRMLPRGI